MVPLGGFIPVFFLGIPPSSEPGSGGDGGFHPAMAYEDLKVTKIGYQQLDNTLACSRLQDSGESESKNKREKPREDWEERVSRRFARLHILGDPGAVSRVGRKGGTKVSKDGQKSP